MIAIRVAKRHRKEGEKRPAGVAGRELVWQRVSKKLQREVLVFLKWARIDPHRSEGWIFPGRDPSKPVHKQSVHDWFTRACIECGIGRKTFHCLRHYRGYTVQAAKHDLSITQRALRHKDAKTTVIYTQPTPDEERKLEDEIDV
jgi:integrase